MVLITPTYSEYRRSSIATWRGVRARQVAWLLGGQVAAGGQSDDDGSRP